MKTEALIIDDESRCRETLQLLLARFCPEVTVISTASSVQEGLYRLNSINPDIIFLDLEINGESGFDVLRQLRQPGPRVVLTTAYEKYAVQAFKFPVVDYLLKPFDSDELVTAVAKCMALSAPAKTVYANSLISSANKVALQMEGEIRFIDCDQIIRCKASGSYTEIFLADGKKVVAVKTLKEVETRLPPYFCRVHHSALVNLRQIVSVGKTDHIITLSDGSCVELSVRKKTEFFEKLAIL